MLFWLDDIIVMQNTFKKFEDSIIPNTYKTHGNVKVGNVDSTEKRRELIICV